jgi:hypothetical protein
MTRPSADVREAELLQKLSDIARMKVDAEPFGNDTLEIEAPPPDEAIFLTVLSESVHNWAPTASRSVHANVFTKESASAGPTRHHPAYPLKCRTSTQRTQAPESVDTRRASALDPLENNIRK